MLATRLILSQLNKIYLCVIKWSRVFYIETGILVYCLVYLEYKLVASSRKLHLFPKPIKVCSNYNTETVQYQMLPQPK